MQHNNSSTQRQSVETPEQVCRTCSHPIGRPDLASNYLFSLVYSVIWKIFFKLEQKSIIIILTCTGFQQNGILSWLTLSLACHFPTKCLQWKRLLTANNRFSSLVQHYFSCGGFSWKKEEKYEYFHNPTNNYYCCFGTVVTQSLVLLQLRQHHLTRKTASRI